MFHLKWVMLVGLIGQLIALVNLLLRALQNHWQLNWAPEGIRVNAVCPTFIQTPMTEPFLKDDDFKKATIGMIPLGRLGEVN